VHDSLTERTGPLTGSGMEETGVPGGTLTVKDTLCPESRVTVTTQVSAEAEGIAPAPRTPSSALAETARVNSFRLLNTVAWLLPTPACGGSTRRDHTTTRIGRY
jgi:hypothetical protein